MDTDLTQVFKIKMTSEGSQINFEDVYSRLFFVNIDIIHFPIILLMAHTGGIRQRGTLKGFAQISSVWPAYVNVVCVYNVIFLFFLNSISKY